MCRSQKINYCQQIQFGQWNHDYENKTGCRAVYIHWLDEYDQSWWNNAYNDTSKLWPEDLTDRNMSTHLRFQKPAIDQVGLAGFLRFIEQIRDNGFVNLLIKTVFLNESPKTGNSLT
eukprot:UN18663